jgi:hypothetical protein
MFRHALLVTPAALFLWLVLWTNSVQGAGWVALAAGLTAWGWLAGRALSMSATLTTDTLRIRNVLTARDIPVSEIADVRFRGGVLRVTQTSPGAVAPGDATSAGEHAVPPGSRYYTVSAVCITPPYMWSGQWTDADAAANSIAAAAGLPPLPARKVKIRLRTALVMITGGLACWVAGLGGQIIGQGGQDVGRHVAMSVLGAIGLYVLLTGSVAALGHVKRRRPAGGS